MLLIEAPPVPIVELESIEDAQQYVSQIEGLQAATSFKDELMSELKVSNKKKEATNKKLEEELASYKKKLWFVAAAFILEALLFTLYFVIRCPPTPNTFSLMIVVF